MDIGDIINILLLVGAVVLPTIANVMKAKQKKKAAEEARSKGDSPIKSPWQTAFDLAKEAKKESKTEDPWKSFIQTIENLSSESRTEENQEDDFIPQQEKKQVSPEKLDASSSQSSPISLNEEREAMKPFGKSQYVQAKPSITKSTLVDYEDVNAEPLFEEEMLKEIEVKEDMYDKQFSVASVADPKNASTQASTSTQSSTHKEESSDEKNDLIEELKKDPDTWKKAILYKEILESKYIG